MKSNSRKSAKSMDLIDAAINNDLTVAAELLSKKADPNAVEDHYNVTPLHHAAQNNSLAVAKLLVNAGASVNAVTIDGYTPIELAEVHGNKEMVEYLTEVVRLH